MSTFTRVHSDQQRGAILQAYFVSRIENMAEIGRLARAGQLKHDGVDIPAWKIPDATVRDYINAEKRRRQGKDRTALSNAPAEDAVEELRRRLVSFIDTETLRLDKDQREKPRTAIDAEQIRKLARALRELDALPGPGEHSKRDRPGRGAQQGNGSAPAKPDSLAGKLDAALGTRRINAPAEAAQSDAQSTQGEHGDPTPPATTETAQRHQHHNTTPGETETDGPGAHARVELAGLRAEAVSVRPV